MPKFYIHRLTNCDFVRDKEGAMLPPEQEAARNIVLNKVRDVIEEQIVSSHSGSNDQMFLSVEDQLGRQVVWLKLVVRSYEYG